MDEDVALAQKLAPLLPQWDERERRLLLAAEARALGRNGVTRVARAAGVSPPTITRDPALLAALEDLVESDTRGDPQSPLRWTCKSTRQLAAGLTQQGQAVSEWTVRRLLH